MTLMSQPTRAEDLNTCLALKTTPRFDDGKGPALLRLWHQVIAERCAESAVIFDEEHRPGHKPSRSGLSVFVTEEFAHEAKTQLPPYMEKQVLDRWARGRSPLLQLDAIREANSGGGLYLLVLSLGIAENSLAPEEAAHAGHLLFNAFLAHH